MRLHLARMCAVIAAVATLSAAVSNQAAAQATVQPAELRAHSAEFRKDLIRVTDDVWIAVGYSASNVALIQGTDGVVIIDTAANPTEAQAIRAAFGKVSRGPVRAIVYTHSHPDHTGGASAFAGDDEPPIIAGFAKPDSPVGRGNRDGGDQFGMALPNSVYINAGVQQEFGRNVKPTREGYLAPTRVISAEREALTIAGVRLEMIRTPGETGDTVSVWLPEKRVLTTGDNVLKTFPNVSPIRGAPTRSAEEWIASLGKLLALKPAFLLPGHMRPILGEENVREVVTAYRDAIQSIYDQTIAGMRRGERPDELARQVQLPPELASHPYLREYYGAVEWTVRGIYANQVGWFDGNATNLFPLSHEERARNLLPLIGGTTKALAAARAALTEGEYEWAAELADHVLSADPASADAKRIKAQALTALGERQGNAIARNYYLSVAQELRARAVSPLP